MMRAAAALAIALLAFSACAKVPAVVAPVAAPAPRDDLYVLLPDPDGKAGMLSVAPGGAEQVLSSPYAAAEIKQEGQLETGSATQEEVKRVFGDALAALPPRPVSFLLYFVEDKDEFTPESQSVVQQIFAEIARHPAPEIVVIGHTDRVGPLAYNDALSLRRAQKVRDDLV